MTGDPGEADPDRPTPAPRTVVEERPLSPMRRTIADRLGESYRSAVHVTLHRDLDAGGLATAVERAGNALEVEVSLLDGLLVAISDALSAHPALNATFEDGVHRTYAEHNLAVAIALEDGLVTPVVADVAARSLAEVAEVRRRLTGRVQAGDYTMADLQGGTFTVSNLGPLGVDAFTPVINPPEVAILGVNRLRETPRRGDGGVEFRPTLPVDLSIDHRVVDGADGARFLETLAGTVGDADALAAQWDLESTA